MKARRTHLRRPGRLMAVKSGRVTTTDDNFGGHYTSFHGNTLGGMAPPVTY